jgi:hypothetical protein
MARVYWGLSWLCTWVGIALLGLSLLAVPENAALGQQSGPMPKCPGQDNCARGCSVNGRGTGCNPGCDTTPPNCTDCECVPVVYDPSGSILRCGCR